MSRRDARTMNCLRRLRAIGLIGLGIGGLLLLARRALIRDFVLPVFPSFLRAAVREIRLLLVRFIHCPKCLALAAIAAEVARHYVILCRELMMEEIRVVEFQSQPPSRQRCLYVCETFDEAATWKPLVGQGSTICELRCTGMIHRADASLLLGDSEPLSVTKDRARKYWRSEMGGSPQPETLFVGNIEVVAVGL